MICAKDIYKIELSRKYIVFFLLPYSCKTVRKELIVVLLQLALEKCLSEKVSQQKKQQMLAKVVIDFENNMFLG